MSGAPSARPHGGLGAFQRTSPQAPRPPRACSSDCADQLRRLHGISIIKLAREHLGDEVYVVLAHATSRDGREDTSMGAVALSGLKGEAKANALMKAETKAKRRVTLSMAGLGYLDETEVETLPGAIIEEVDLQAEGLSHTPPSPSPAAAPAARGPLGSADGGAEIAATQWPQRSVGDPQDVNAWVSAIMATLRRLVPGTDETSREDQVAVMRECFGPEIVGERGYKLKGLPLAALQGGFGRLSRMRLTPDADEEDVPEFSGEAVRDDADQTPVGDLDAELAQDTGADEPTQAPVESRVVGWAPLDDDAAVIPEVPGTPPDVLITKALIDSLRGRATRLKISRLFSQILDAFEADMDDQGRLQLNATQRAQLNEQFTALIERTHAARRPAKTR